MIKNKMSGFTLSEVLITLAVTGLLAVLVLPGLIKDTTNKATSSLLQSTVTSLNDAVQNELSFTGAKKIEDTNIWNNPATFLKRTLDVKEVCDKPTPNDCFAKALGGYRAMDGSKYQILNTTNAVLLSNGVAIDIIPNQVALFKGDHLPIGLDLNGPKPPNILGVDRQILCISLETNVNEGTHVGDVGGCLRNDIVKTQPKSELQALCKAGKPEVCFYLLEQSGFNHKYLEDK